MKLKSFFQLHIAVFLFGFTAILGDLIQLPLVSLVWWRVFLTILFLVFFIKSVKSLRLIDSRFIWKHFVIGILVSLHWLAFYGSIKVSNASIVLIAMSTTSFITALVEPLLIKSSKWRRFDLIISVLVIPAMMLIYYNANEVQQLGLWLGLIASFIGAVFSVLNKMWLIEDKEYEIIFIQQGTVWLSLSLLLLVFYITGNHSFEIPSGIDWFYLLLFAIACTILPYFLYLKAMRILNAFDVSFAFNMEPVYGLLMAALILKDHQELSAKIYLGMFLIIVMVGIHTLLKSRKKRKLKKATE